jgi:Fe-S cluster biogenesis protein NfuA
LLFRQRFATISYPRKDTGKGGFRVLDKTKVSQSIDKIRPLLQRDGGDVQLIEVTDEGIVKVKLMGACGSCPMSIMTLKNGIEARLKQEIPEVKSVVSV